MKPFKLVTVVGTRPEIIRLSRVIARADEVFEHTLVHTGQNYDPELSQVFFDELGLRTPDVIFENSSRGQSPSTAVGNIISETDKLLEKVQPDAFLVLGDTNSCLAAYAAKRRRIPVFHMEAGNRCFDARVPEEINRRVVDHLADINMPYSQIARQYLLNEGLPPQNVIVTGSPMKEVISHFLPKIEKSQILEKLKLQREGYIIASVHREENVDQPERLEKILASLVALKEKYGKPIYLSTHPRTQNRLNELSSSNSEKIFTLKPFGFFDYICLQRNSFLAISDSGTITEESSILNFPALNLRESHERPEGMEEASVMMTGLNPERVLQCADLAQTQSRDQDRQFFPVQDYQAENVSEKVIRIILSYTDAVRVSI